MSKQHDVYVNEQFLKHKIQIMELAHKNDWDFDDIVDFLIYSMVYLENDLFAARATIEDIMSNYNMKHLKNQKVH